MKVKAITRQSRRRFLQVVGVVTAALMLEGLPLSGEHTPAEIRQIVATLN